MPANQARIYFGDETDAREYWATREWKTFAIDVVAGPSNRPTYRHTVYVRARTAAEAISSAKRNMIGKPSRPRYSARLAGPRELGCVPAPSTITQH
ncbi:hypothetical protein MCB86_16740 [Pseudomonas sp. KSR10]|uniref:hypothetical protein n=1 Tax=Pseudomonas sp. KSR10 TaxID=2916654 RepID=UPI001EF7697B|nr:hypothetical protein [Pseudomonas sp. KSR10]MCG6541722.1 hypothetical protein [Pseudomonas sp. KSR10]